MKEGEPNPLAQYLIDYIDLEKEIENEESMNKPGYRGQMSAKALYLYELAEHPTPWKSMDDEDLVQPRDDQ